MNWGSRYRFNWFNDGTTIPELLGLSSGGEARGSGQNEVGKASLAIQNLHSTIPLMVAHALRDRRGGFFGGSGDFADQPIRHAAGGRRQADRCHNLAGVVDDRRGDAARAFLVFFVVKG